MQSHLIQCVEGFGRPRVLVVGDVILDRYIWGDAERISQEAPVVLLRADRREERLGGAASVATMLASLGAEVHLAGVVGADAAADSVRSLLTALKIDHSLLMEDASRPTTLKERYIGRAQQKHPQQMMRVDFETRDPISDELANRLAKRLVEDTADAKVVLISDYDKGVCRADLNAALIAAGRRLGVKVVVDPIRGGDYRRLYHGCTTMTPNRLEASLATGVGVDSVESAMDAADRLRVEVGMDVGIVTLDKEGMVLAEPGGRRHFACRPREVYDITGAGDMVLAVLGLAIASGADYPEAIALANSAGGLEVERIGVAAITREELIEDLAANSSDRGDKILLKDQLLRRLDRKRQAGETIVFTNGCFDVLHLGHVQYLAESKAQGHVLVVGLNADASVRRLGKGPERPINPEDDRAAVLAALAVVDFVCLFEEDTPAELITAVRPDVLVKGEDYRPDEVVGAEFVQSYGGRLHLAKLVRGRSTTNVISRLKAA